MKKYRPSNGTEGMGFIEKFCCNCIHGKYEHSGDINDNPCEILSRSFMYDLKDKEYPEEWIYDENNKPCCTAWQKWDWGRDGDPDDPDNPNYRPPDNPNQLVMPFLLDEIGVPEIKFLPSSEQDVEVCDATTVG